MYCTDKVVSLSEEEEHPEDMYNHRAATTAMRNNLHKSQAGQHVWPRLAHLQSQRCRGEGARLGNVGLHQGEAADGGL